jgi:hypothetical protein
VGHAGGVIRPFVGPGAWWHDRNNDEETHRLRASPTRPDLIDYSAGLLGAITI